MLATKRQARDFQVTLVLEELRQFPLSHGTIFAKWKLQPQVADPHFGFTKRTQVVRNTVIWNDRFTFSVKLGAAGERGEELRSCGLRISIREEKNIGHIRHGIIELDLAEYAGLPTVRKNFLLQESRTNAVLSLSLTLRQTSGDPTFKRPFKSVKVTLPSSSDTQNSSVNELQSNPDIEEIHVKKTDKEWVEVESTLVDSSTAEKNFFYILENNTENSLFSYAKNISENMEQLEWELEEEIPAHIRATRIDAEALIEKIIRDVIPKKAYEVEEMNSSKLRENKSSKATNDMDNTGNQGHDLDIGLLKKTRDSGALYTGIG
ncbi:hypothetical protein Gasu_23350 isoform 1 [Galdieria sulphuraria]|uniref:C2 NT-type domain-containing protein n=1 Tax=Galdieria sulphuraria TaxID=130081 RepID=M2Y3A4_GALSU|nr:hypothetical protein Gasu_23350 isoform 1 [Galdieria sulphuraria]EME30433.1 hypothetical protein Gasu_23350 isoform 1 [Galdieria sulphuraria]|eukprot:XP_005706953.1 hypothetical protein isoform 1 [Galdieria sulphuraria]